MLQGEDQLKEAIRYKTEQIKLLVVGFISIGGGCLSLLSHLNTVIDLISVELGACFCALFFYQGVKKHWEIKKRLKL